MRLDKYVRTVKDFPKKGINFRDITPLILAPKAFRFVISELSKTVKKHCIDTIVAIESRGFVFASAISFRLGLPLTLVRKFGKLPYKCETVKYDLEYGSSRLQIHSDSLKKRSRVAIIDDVLATGGTVVATCELIRKLNAKPVLVCLLLEIDGLDGALNIQKKEPELEIVSLMSL
ncbi:MAG: adenine phosphoribosyltransferase [Planctomycetes bacterium]|nr:adenine phosphoribosyltransferase [Planctomycetota bacterium]